MYQRLLWVNTSHFMFSLNDIIGSTKGNLAVLREDLLYIYMNDITTKSIHLIIHLIYGKDFLLVFSVEVYQVQLPLVIYTGHLKPESLF